MDTEIKPLVVASSAEALAPVARGVQALGLTPEPCVDVDALPPGPLEHDLVFWVSPGERSGLARLLPRVRDEAQLVALVPPGTDLASVAHLITDPRCNHVLQLADADGGSALAALVDKLLSGDIFGLERHLPDAEEVHYIRLSNYRGRTEAVDRIVAHAEASHVRRPVRTTIAQVCEELLMNALYNAPVDDVGRSLFANVTPRDRLALDSPRPVSIRFAASPSRFGVAVRDRYGTLTKDTLLRYVHKCLHSRRQIDGKTLGAGLGLFLVISRAHEYIVNIAPGVATEAIAVFAKRGSATGAPGTLGVYVHPGAPAMAASAA